MGDHIRGYRPRSRDMPEEDSCPAPRAVDLDVRGLGSYATTDAGLCLPCRISGQGTECRTSIQVAFSTWSTLDSEIQVEGLGKPPPALGTQEKVEVREQQRHRPRTFPHDIFSKRFPSLACPDKKGFKVLGPIPGAFVGRNNGG